MQKLLRTCVVAALCSLTFLSLPVLHAQVPPLVNCQGRVAVGATTCRGNSSAGVARSEPTAAVALTVTKGLYSRPTLHS